MKLIKFSAEWCGPCRTQKKEFETKPLDNVELIEINIDEDDEALTSKYKVMSIPTLVLINDNDEVINKWVGFTKSEVINEFIQNLK